MGDFIFFLTVVGLFILSGLKVLKEYERGVVFLLGRFYKVKGPGLVVVIPFLQTITRVSLRTIAMDIPSQDIVSKDNVSVRVSAVVYFRVKDARSAVIEVEHFIDATSQLAQTSLRSVLGEHDLDQMLSERDALNKKICKILDVRTAAWGIDVLNVEIKDIDLNESMIRAIARQAEAERARRAKVIHAEGELQASEQLAKAAAVLSQNKVAIQLRTLQTLSDISANDKSSTIIFPIDMVQTLIEKIKE